MKTQKTKVKKEPKQEQVMVQLMPDIRRRLDDLREHRSKVAPVTLRQIISQLILEAHNRECNGQK